MKKLTIVSTFILIFLSGCTQVVTAPIKIAGATAGAALDVVGSAGGAVVKTVTGGGKDDD